MVNPRNIYANISFVLVIIRRIPLFENMYRYARQRWRLNLDAKRTMSQRWEAYRPTKGLAAWALVVGAVGVMLVGFTWGGWVTGGTARSMADSAATATHDQLVAAICVDRFQTGTDASIQLAALKALVSYERGSFIEKGGWAAMPPEKAVPTRTASRLCADQLAAL